MVVAVVVGNWTTRFCPWFDSRNDEDASVLYCCWWEKLKHNTSTFGRTTVTGWMLVSSDEKFKGNEPVLIRGLVNVWPIWTGFRGCLCCASWKFHKTDVVILCKINCYRKGGERTWCDSRFWKKWPIKSNSVKSTNKTIIHTMSARSNAIKLWLCPDLYYCCVDGTIMASCKTVLINMRRCEWYVLELDKHELIVWVISGCGRFLSYGKIGVFFFEVSVSKRLR